MKVINHSFVQLGLLLFLILSISRLSAEPLYQFHTLSKEEGLSSTVVYDVTQDKSGFIWLATEDGLQKYDGFNLVTYRHNRSQEDSISNNMVRTLLVDNVGALWVGTDNGLNLYSKKYDNFKRFFHDKENKNSIASNQIRTIYQTSEGNIWIGTSKGLSKISSDHKTITNFPHLKVRSILEDERKQLWIGTLGGGVFLFNERTGVFQPIKSEEEGLSIVDLFRDSFNRVLVATWGQGVFLLDRERRQLVPFALELPSKNVRTIHQDKEGNLWFGTKSGILVLEPMAKKSSAIFALESSNSSLKVNNIMSFFQGDDDTIWVGTYGGGVSRFFPSSRKFENYGLHPQYGEGLVEPVVYAISENAQGKVWIGTELGKIALFDPTNKTFQHFPLAQHEQLDGYAILAIHQINDNSILIGTINGAFKYDYQSNKLIKVSQQESILLSQNETIVFIEEDKNKIIWIGVRGHGLFAFKFNPKTKKLEEIKTLRFKVEDPKNMIFDPSGSPILSTSNSGIFNLKISTDHKTLEAVKVSNSENLGILDINLDWKNRIWVATLSNGIKIINPTGFVKTLDELDGLPNNNVYSILSDVVSNRVWATTNSGMVSIDPDNLKLYHYTASDGLQNDEFNSAALKSSLGYFYFAGVDGFNRFFPNVIENSFYVRKPRIIGLKIANKKIVIGSDQILNQALSITKKIELNYDQTPFSIEFTSPQFVKPQDLHFRYRLRGLSDEWLYSTSENRLATYTNISAGKYKFELQVGSSLDTWNDEIKTLEVIIHPPWWNTTLAKFIYALLVAFFIGLIVIYRYKKSKEERAAQIAIKENEERLKLSLWGSGYEFWDWNLETGDVSRSNEFKKIEIDCPKLSKDLSQLASYIHPQDLSVVRDNLGRHVAGDTNYFDLCYRVVDAKKGWRWIQDRGKVVAVDNSGNALRMSGTQRDITDIREKDTQFEMLGQAFKSTSDGVWIRDHEWCLVECNPAYERITGFSLGEKKGEALWFPEYQEQPQNLMQRIRISIEEKGNWQGEAWAERKNNDPFPQKLSIDTLLDENGNVRYYVGVFSDITFHKRAEEEFRKLANYDSLTGLPNRACLYDRLNQTIEKAKRYKKRFALFLIDIDNFKRINDSLGHSVGDHLIRQVSSRLVNCNKEGDTVARIGGDEFMIIVENIKSSTAVATFSELVLKELNQPIFVKGQKLKLNFSIGITLAPEDGMSAERLTRNSDTAMYEAKKSVENSYRFYSIEFNERARKRLVLETALRKAIEYDSVELYYQPKIDLNTGRVDGVEALARWFDDKFGLISPMEFIPLAEETGLIIPLGKQLLRKAINQTKQWVDTGVMRGKTSVNLSAHQFWDRKLAKETLRMLEEENLEAKYIQLEITESACMQNVDETISQINALKELGFSLALDDFGTGYSSLSQLKMFPFDTLKVDKSFVDNIETNGQDAKVVKAIIDIAKTMEMEVVIEGVETQSQCKYLWMNRAYVVQGYYFSKPLKVSECTEIFEKQWEKDDYLKMYSASVTPLG